MGDVKQKINKQKISFKNDLDPEVKNLILSMLQIDPHRRPSVAQILQNPFFNNLKQSIDDQFFSNKSRRGVEDSSNRSTKKKMRRAYRTNATAPDGKSRVEIRGIEGE